MSNAESSPSPINGADILDARLSRAEGEGEQKQVGPAGQLTGARIIEKVFDKKLVTYNAGNFVSSGCPQAHPTYKSQNDDRAIAMHQSSHIFAHAASNATFSVGRIRSIDKNERNWPLPAGKNECPSTRRQLPSS